MAEAVVSVVLEALGHLLGEEARLLSGVSTQVEDLCRELKHIQYFLKDADSKQSKDESICNWLREIRTLCYRIEDLVESYAIQVEASQRQRGIKKFLKRCACIFGEIRSLHKLGTEIGRVQADISSITNNLQKYNVVGIGGLDQEGDEDQQYHQWVRQTYAHQVEDYFVGMEDDIRNLVSLLKSDDKNHSIISIWGMGGIGKTTLARKVYKHEDVQSSFDRFAWTCVTQQAQIDVILADLFVQLFPERNRDVKSMTGRELIRELHQAQMEAKCLIVVDDIWKVDDWNSILAAFPFHEGSSTKLLLTTRIGKVAEIGFPYKLKCLSEDDGWELLRKIAASSGRSDLTVAPEFKDVGMKLVSNCGGLPLAISLLGGILKDKSSLADWEMINRDVSSYLNNMEEDGGSLARVLSLSYDELPYHLKLCFLYFGNFKEDKEIYTRLLHLLWTAEGLVLAKHQRSRETLVEVSERYLKELCHRCMVQLKVNEVTLTPTSCSLHDLMRDFCLEKCKQEEFVKVIDAKLKHPFGDSLSTANVTRLAICINSEDSVGDMICSADQEGGKRTRTLFCLSPFNGYFGKGVVWPEGVVIKNFRMLRVLNFESFDFGCKLPLELHNLIHLKILVLLFCRLDELPSYVAELPFLQTLVLELKNRIKIPNVISKMRRLKNLGFGSEHCARGGGKLRLSGLRGLERLWGFDDEVDEIADLSGLLSLVNLQGKVKGIGNFYVLMDYIDANENLREIDLEIDDCDFVLSEKGYGLLTNFFKCGSLQILNLSAKLGKFPCYEQHFLPCLTVLNLGRNYMEEDPMETLGKLPQLKSLRLNHNSYTGQQLICHELGFPQLTYLHLIGLPNLESWRVDKGSMPNLYYLDIQYCPSLAMIPDGLRFVEGLKVLYVAMPYQFCNRIRIVDDQEGPDYYKIQHVPFVSTKAVS